MGEASIDIAVNLDSAESDFEYRLPRAGLAAKGLVRVVKGGEFIEALGNRRTLGLDRSFGFASPLWFWPRRFYGNGHIALDFS